MNQFSYTSEQLNIILAVKEMCANEILKINAFAGTGKTSTLVAIAKSLPDKKFLYLAFNNAIVTESRNKFPKNVAIFTTHQLAYRKIVKNMGATVRNEDIKPIEISSTFKCSNIMAYDSLKIFNQFLNSDRHSFWEKKSEAHEIAYKLYESMENNECDITHSFYLKQYQLLKDKTLSNYDYVMLDEGQDTNDVVLDIFLNIDAAKIIVGDTHQSIYAWRGAQNAMDKIEADFNFYLTKTFRCDQLIVDRANYVLKKFKGETTQIISACSKEKTDDSYAVITRTNAKMIENFAEFDDDYTIIKHPQAIFSTAINLHNWLTSQWDKISPDFEYLKNFRNRREFENYIEETKSLELKSSLSIAQRYKKGLFLLYSKAAKAYKKIEGKDDRIVLLTGHASKGLEFDRVDIENDFPFLPEIYEEDDKLYSEQIEEANLFYVATTRAKFFLNDSSKNNSLFD